MVAPRGIPILEWVHSDADAAADNASGAVGSYSLTATTYSLTWAEQLSIRTMFPAKKLEETFRKARAEFDKRVSDNQIRAIIEFEAVRQTEELYGVEGVETDG